MPGLGAAPIPLCIDYAELCDHSKTNDLGPAIETAFGINGLGLLTIKNVPNYTTFRQALLPLAAKLAQLPQDQKNALEDPLSSYNFGWSQGKEKLENGAPDSNKGSFYANPLIDKPTEDLTLLREQPAYCRPNLWPTEQLPELEPAFKALGRVIYDVGMLVTEQCSTYLAAKGIDVKPPLPEVLSRSICHKVRNVFITFILLLSLLERQKRKLCVIFFAFKCSCIKHYCFSYYKTVCRVGYYAICLPVKQIMNTRMAPRQHQPKRNLVVHSSSNGVAGIRIMVASQG
jgi:non-haem dioxygenase in morphine synthesis N-terminal